MVESLDTEVVAFAPMLASHHPRVIAVGEGNGNLLRVTLLLSEECRMRRGAGGGSSGSSSGSKQNKPNASPLASALASIEVDFNNVDVVSKQESIQNDGTVGRERKNYRNNGDLADIIGKHPSSRFSKKTSLISFLLLSWNTAARLQSAIRAHCAGTTASGKHSGRAQVTLRQQRQWPGGQYQQHVIHGAGHVCATHSLLFCHHRLRNLVCGLRLQISSGYD